MLVNLSDVLTSEGKQTTMEVPLDISEFKGGAQTFEVLDKTPVAFIFTNLEVDKAKVECNVTLTFRTYCDRCLTEVPTILKLHCERIVVSPEAVTESEDLDDQTFMEGYQLNVEDFICNEIIGNWPVKILCKEDCKGLCPVCGQNLNEKECGCDTFVPDPRMAGIQDIFNANNKEV